MLPDPLHPAVVHFPIALAILVPLLALLVLTAIRAGVVPARAWAVVVLAQVLLAGSAWFATETGEDQEERVEEVVAERHIETHEEAAEWLFRIAVIGALVSATGLLAGRAGSIGRAVTLVAGVAAIAASVQAGRTGGALVYEHGAASAYVGHDLPAPASTTGPSSPIPQEPAAD